MAASGTPRGDLLAVARVRGAEVKEAAQLAGCSLRTAYRRLNDPAFRVRLDGLRSQMIDQAVAKLSGTMGAAADKLRELLSSKNEKIALAAARAVLELGQKLRDETELVRRIEVLEMKRK